MSTSNRRKALAIAAASSMSVIGVTGLPALALDGGQSDQTQVALAPTAGDNYGMIIAEQGTFSLTANESAAVAGGDQRFIIEDPTGNIIPTAASTNVAVDTDDNYVIDADNDDIEYSRTADGVVTLTDNDASNPFADFDAGVIFNLDTTVDSGGGDGSLDLLAGNYLIISNTGDDVITFRDGRGEQAAVTVPDDVEIATLENGDGNDITRTLDADDNYEDLVITSGTNTQTTTAALVLSTVEVDDTYTVDVTAVVDDNENDEIDGTEFRSPTRTISFYDEDDLSATGVSWTAVLGAASASVDVTISPALNYNYSAVPTATLTNAEGDFAGAATVARDEQVLTVSDDADQDGGTLQAGLVTLQLTGGVVGTIDTERFNVQDNSVRNMVVSMTDSSTLAFTQTSDTDDNNDLNDEDGPTATAVTDSSQTIVVTVFDDDGDTVSGAVVTADDAAGANIGSDEDGVYTFAGEDVAANGTFDAVSVTTNSSGQALFEIVVVDADEAAAADIISADFSVEGVTAGLASDLDEDETVQADEISPNADIQVTYADRNHTVEITSIVHADGTAADQAGNAEADAAFGDGVAYSVKLTDQFGEAPTTTMRMRGLFSQDDADGNAVTSNFFADVVDGEASLNIANNSDAARGVITSTFTIQSFDADLQNWAQNTDVTWTDADAGNSGSFFLDTTAVETGLVNVTDDTPAAVAVGVTELTAANELTGDDTPDWVADNTAVTVSGTVEEEATGTAITGSPVTITGADNLIFEADGVYSFGELTAWSAGDDGAWAFDVYSTTSGEFEVTISSRDGSSTATLEFNAALADVDNAVIATTIPAETIFGNTYEVSVLLTDAFGNAVDTAAGDLSVVFSGAGNIVGTAPTQTDEDGLATFDLALTGAVASNASLTVTYAGLDSDIDATDDNVSDVTSFNITAPVVITADSVVVSGVAEVVAGETAVYTVTVTDEDGNALEGRSVTMNEAGVGEITLLSGTTDADGQVTTTLVTTTAGNSFISAIVDGKSATLAVKVVEPAPVVEPEPEPEPTGVVNVGSFNGKVVVYAKDLVGSTVSWKIAGKWQTVEVTEDFERFDRPTAAIGLDINVDIYVDGELRLSKTVTTK